MKPSTVLFVLGGALFGIKFLAGYQSTSNGGALPNWYPSSLASIDTTLPIKLDYLLLGSGVAAYFLGY